VFDLMHMVILAALLARRTRILRTITQDAKNTCVCRENIYAVVQVRWSFGKIIIDIFPRIKDFS
jgi:hypothetical protein